MIAREDTLTIKIIPIECIQCKEHQERYTEQILKYIRLMKIYPEQYPGILHVEPSDTHSGMYSLLDGHTRFCAHIMTGRKEALCVIIEKEKK